MGKRNESFTLETGSSKVGTVDASKTEKIEKYFSVKKDREPEIAGDCSFEGSQKNGAGEKKNTDKIITAEELEKIKKETADIKLEIEELEKAYAKKRGENSGFFKRFRIVPGSLGESAREEKRLSLKLLVKRIEVADNEKKIKEFEGQCRVVKKDNNFEKNISAVLEDLRECIDKNGTTVDEKWENIKSLNFYEAARKMNWRENDKLDGIFKNLRGLLGDDVRPGGVETLEKWTKRISKMAAEKSQ